MKKDDSKFKEAPKKLDNPISPNIFFSHAYEIKSLRVAIVGDDDDCVYLEYVRPCKTGLTVVLLTLILNQFVGTSCRNCK